MVKLSLARGLMALGSALALAVCGGCGSDSPSAPSSTPTPPTSPDRVVLFDQGHFSGHTVRGTYAFASIVEGDGWTVMPVTRIDEEVLNQGRILVVVNALHPSNVNNWTLPISSAFSAPETSAVQAWVNAGGGLLLIADHMPFPGAVESLATPFRVRFSNGFAFDTTQLDEPRGCLTEDQVQVFRSGDGSLRNHATTSGINAIATFTGSAFQSDGQPPMVFGATAVSLEPTTAWEFEDATPTVPVAGW